MQNMKKKTRHKGMGIIGTLTLLFIVLKVTDVISWSWIWVLSPIWLSACLSVIVFGTILIVGRLIKGKW